MIGEPQPRPSYWLVASRESGVLEVLTLGLPGNEEVLLVFSLEEEAEAFIEEAGKLLRLEALGGGWRVRETGAGELVSMLLGPYAGIERVALDPLTELSAETAVELVGMGREEFMQIALLGATPEKEADDERWPGEKEQRGGE